MARVLGYGGVANTNGARDFTGKATADVASQPKLLLMFVGYMIGMLWR